MLTSTSRVLERDFAMQRDLERVLLGLPNLGHECQSHMFTEDVNLCEAYAGRLEDVISFIRVISRTFPAVSEHVTAAESILTNYLSHFQDRIHFLEGPFTISGRFRCPRLVDGSVGRPRFEIPERILWAMRSIGFRWVSIAKMLMVSERTLRRRRIELGWIFGGNEFSDISNNDLDDLVRNIVSLTPNAGETMTFGALRGRGLRVQRHRIRESIGRVDPVGRSLRRQRTINRRVYNVPSPNFLW